MLTPLQVADRAERYLAGEISWADFMRLANEIGNDQLSYRLIDEIEHEPQLKNRHGDLLPEGEKYLMGVRELVAAIRGTAHS